MLRNFTAAWVIAMLSGSLALAAPQATAPAGPTSVIPGPVVAQPEGAAPKKVHHKKQLKQRRKKTTHTTTAPPEAPAPNPGPGK